MDSSKTIYNVEIFLYMTRCAVTSPTLLTEIDLYSFKENPVAATLSPANRISNATALMCSQKLSVPILQYILYLMGWA